MNTNRVALMLAFAALLIVGILLVCHPAKADTHAVTNTAELITAIGAVSDGDVISMANANYTLVTQPEFDKSITVTGESKNGVIIYHTTYQLYVKSTGIVSFNNLTIIGNNKVGITSNGSISFDNCNITSFSQDAITGSNLYCNISNSQIYSRTAKAIVSSGIFTGNISDSYIYCNPAGGPGYQGLAVSGIFTGNITRCTFVGDQGLFIGSGSYINIFSTNFTVTSYPLQLSSPSNVVKIENCNVVWQSDSCIVGLILSLNISDSNLNGTESTCCCFSISTALYLNASRCNFYGSSIISKYEGVFNPVPYIGINITNSNMTINNTGARKGIYATSSDIFVANSTIQMNTTVGNIVGIQGTIITTNNVTISTNQTTTGTKTGISGTTVIANNTRIYLNGTETGANVGITSTVASIITNSTIHLDTTTAAATGIFASYCFLNNSAIYVNGTSGAVKGIVSTGNIDIANSIIATFDTISYGATTGVSIATDKNFNATNTLILSPLGKGVYGVGNLYTNMTGCNITTSGGEGLSSGTLLLGNISNCNITTEFYPPVSIGTSFYGDIIHCNITAIGNGMGIYVGNSFYGNFTSCKVITNGGIGVYVGPFYGNITFCNISAISAISMSIGTPFSGNISNCVITTGAGMAISISTTSYGNITNCTISSGTSYGINIGTVSYGNITNCSVTSGYDGIKMGGASRGNITGTTINVTTAGYSGILINGASYNDIANCNITSIGGIGVGLVAGITCVNSGINASNTTIHVQIGTGIWIKATAVGNTTLLNCDITDIVGTGLAILGRGNLSIVNCNITTQTDSAINFSAIGNLSLTNCDLTSEKNAIYYGGSSLTNITISNVDATYGEGYSFIKYAGPAVGYSNVYGLNSEILAYSGAVYTYKDFTFSNPTGTSISISNDSGVQATGVSNVDGIYTVQMIDRKWSANTSELQLYNYTVTDLVLGWDSLPMRVIDSDTAETYLTTRVDDTISWTGHLGTFSAQTAESVVEIQYGTTAICFGQDTNMTASEFLTLYPDIAWIGMYDESTSRFVYLYQDSGTDFNLTYSHSYIVGAVASTNISMLNTTTNATFTVPYGSSFRGNPMVGTVPLAQYFDSPEVVWVGVKVDTRYVYYYRDSAVLNETIIQPFESLYIGVSAETAIHLTDSPSYTP